MSAEKEPVITVALLKWYGACSEECDLFAQLWPKGARITVDNALLAIQHCLDIGWLAANVLSSKRFWAYRVADVAAWRSFTRGGITAEAYRRRVAEALVDALTQERIRHG